MLFRQPILERIQKGEITLAFRKWKRPTVKTGGTLTTSVGVLAIDSVDKITVGEISEEDARLAGSADREALLKELRSREGDLYRITLSVAGEDPRLALREDSELSDEALTQLMKRLDRLDAASKLGPWTQKVLHAIQQNPNLAAVDLAKRSGYEKEWLKTNVRKLKNLGLTISHHPGYTLSPRGEAVLERLAKG